MRKLLAILFTAIFSLPAHAGKELANELALTESWLAAQRAYDNVPGLSAAVVAFISSTALDITGISLGITLAGLGLLILPRRRAQAKRDLHVKMQELRDGLDEGLGEQLERELLAGLYGENVAAYIDGVHFGPGDIRREHGFNEYVRTEEVIQCAKIFAALIIDYCRPSGTE